METDEHFEERIDELARAASDASEAFEPPAEVPHEERAAELVSDGLGPTVSLFVEARTGGRSVYFSPEHYDRLEGAMNEWLELYAACYGVDLEGAYQLREAAQALVDTHDAAAVARLLTGVPERE